MTTGAATATPTPPNNLVLDTSASSLSTAATTSSASTTNASSASATPKPKSAPLHAKPALSDEASAWARMTAPMCPVPIASSVSSPSAADSDCAADVDDLLEGIDRIRIEDLWKTPQRPNASSNLKSLQSFASESCNPSSNTTTTDYSSFFASHGPFGGLPLSSTTPAHTPPQLSPTHTHSHHDASTSSTSSNSSSGSSSSSSSPFANPLSQQPQPQPQPQQMQHQPANHHLQAFNQLSHSHAHTHPTNPLASLNHACSPLNQSLSSQLSFDHININAPPSNSNPNNNNRNSNNPSNTNSNNNNTNKPFASSASTTATLLAHSHAAPHQSHNLTLNQTVNLCHHSHPHSLNNANAHNHNHARNLGHSHNVSVNQSPLSSSLDDDNVGHTLASSSFGSVDDDPILADGSSRDAHSSSHCNSRNQGQQQHGNEKSVVVSGSGADIRADFPRMFKVLPCPTRAACEASGETAECFYYHDPVVDRRRANVAAYKPHMCRFVDEPGGCRKAERCPFAHNDFERRYHPDRFGKETCRDFLRGDCPRRYCTFRHHVSRKVQVALDQMEAMADKEMLQLVLKMSDERGRALCDKLLRRFGHGKKHSGWKLDGFVVVNNNNNGRGDDPKVRLLAARVDTVKKRLKQANEKKWAASLKTCSLRDMMSGVRKVAEEMRERCRADDTFVDSYPQQAQQNGSEVHRLIRSVFSNTNWSCHSQDGDNPFLVTPDNQNEAVTALERLVECLVPDDNDHQSSNNSSNSKSGYQAQQQQQHSHVQDEGDEDDDDDECHVGRNSLQTLEQEHKCSSSSSNNNNNNNKNRNNNHNSASSMNSNNKKKNSNHEKMKNQKNGGNGNKEFEDEGDGDADDEGEGECGGDGSNVTRRKAAGTGAKSAPTPIPLAARTTPGLGMMKMNQLKMPSGAAWSEMSTSLSIIGSSTSTSSSSTPSTSPGC